MRGSLRTCGCSYVYTVGWIHNILKNQLYRGLYPHTPGRLARQVSSAISIPTKLPQTLLLLLWYSKVAWEVGVLKH